MRIKKNSQSISYLYNPQNLSKDDLVSSFIVRQKTFSRIFKDIKEARMQHPEQHILIEGKQGMGKTTLLLRLSYEVQNDALLRKWLIPLVFNEEEYSIRKLFKLWERIAELLEAQAKDFKGLKSQMKFLSAAHNSDDEYEKEGFDLLTKSLKEKGKKIILFIDNATDMFAKFSKKESHRFRKILQTSTDIRIIAASAVPVSPFYDYRHPFYEFFKIERLQGLETPDTFRLLSKIGNLNPQKNVDQILQNQKGRIETLRRLTGGVIRTILLLFELFMDDEDGEAFQDLETVLDRVTPLYKHRMDDLPAPQQEIVEAIALSWDAISVKEIAQLTRMESKVISAQLSLLVKNDVIHKIRTNTKNNLYQVNDRFFNIWYLMRNGRNKDHDKVVWLVRFLEEWCDEVDVTDHAKQQISHLKNGLDNPQTAFYITDTLVFTKHIASDIQDVLLENTKQYLVKNTINLTSQLSKSDLTLYKKAMILFENTDYNAALPLFLKMKKQDNIRIAYSYESGSSNYEQAALFYQKAIDENTPNASYFLACIYHKQENKFQKAEALYLSAIKHKNPEAAFALGILYLANKKMDKAQNSFKIASELGNFDAQLMLILVDISIFKNEDNAEATLIQLLNENEIISPDFDYTPVRLKLLGLGFVFLLSRGHYDFLYHFFNMEKAETLHFKDRFKPIYYALLFFLKDQYLNEYLRMGSELKETVEEIVAHVEGMRLDLSS
jgi:tetratricopeptide (TPR) repeat protein/DNA polymerase III delta prime subunit